MRATVLTALLLATALTLAAAPARAQVFGADPLVVEQEEYRSPQYFCLEIKLGPYSPDIDNEFGGKASPFKDIFGDGQGLMVKGELDVELWRPFGTIAIGGAIGWYNNTAKARADNGDDDTPSTLIETTAGETSITLIPMALLLIYRADFLFYKYKVPVIPFVKLGVNYTVWWIDKGDGETARYKEFNASGGTFGWQFNGGIALALDAFEPKAAKTLDMETGINHTYLFFEFVYIQADGFGSDTALNVGETGWQAGLAFEF